MAITKINQPKNKSGTGKILRFAHPFYTNIPPEERTPLPGIGQRMIDFVATKLLPFPDPQREPKMMLAEIIGQQGVTEIELHSRHKKYKRQEGK